MERVIASGMEKEVVRALKRRASANGRDLALELKAIAAGVCSSTDREKLVARLAERRKAMASKAYPEGGDLLRTV